MAANIKDKQEERYNRTDTLATLEDLEALFDTLRKFDYKNGHNPVFTVISLVANPDFNKISEDRFLRYHYEPFMDTLRR